eukprot:10734460-Lingulodinium_polyedra.AAC.1
MHRGAFYGVFVQNSWKECFGELLPIYVCTDSLAGRAMALRRGVGRVRHFDVRQLTVQQLTNSKRVTVLKVHSEENLADMGTKVLGEAPMQELLRRMGVTIA